MTWAQRLKRVFAINVWLHEEFARRGIEFACPTTKHFNASRPAPEGPA